MQFPSYKYAQALLEKQSALDTVFALCRMIEKHGEHELKHELEMMVRTMETMDKEVE